jgi:hypothetical protein
MSYNYVQTRVFRPMADKVLFNFATMYFRLGVFRNIHSDTNIDCSSSLIQLLNYSTRRGGNMRPAGQETDRFPCLKFNNISRISRESSDLIASLSAKASNIYLYTASYRRLIPQQLLGRSQSPMRITGKKSHTSPGLSLTLRIEFTHDNERPSKY